jgi:hypothetical protein
MAVTPVYGWRIPDLGSVADGPDGFSDLALDIEGTVNGSNILAYTPSWSSDGGNQPTNPASRSGTYQVRNKVCQFAARLTFGSSTNAGTGILRVGLPLQARAGMLQFATCYLYVPNDHPVWFGQSEIRGGENTCIPGFTDRTNGLFGYWINGAEGTSAPTGQPRTVNGGYSVTNGGYIQVAGSYFVA